MIARAAVLAVLAAASCTREGAPEASETGAKAGANANALDPAKYAAYLTRYPFGGHTTEAWSARLTELKAGGDAALFALTVERAQANGLVVEEQGAAVHVKPGPELAALILKRMEVE